MAMQLPASLRQLRICRSWQGFLPPPLVARIAPLRPQLQRLCLYPLPAGWENVGGEEPWELN